MAEPLLTRCFCFSEQENPSSFCYKSQCVWTETGCESCGEQSPSRTEIDIRTLQLEAWPQDHHWRVGCSLRAESGWEERSLYSAQRPWLGRQWENPATHTPLHTHILQWTLDDGSLPFSLWHRSVSKMLHSINLLGICQEAANGPSALQSTFCSWREM